MLDMSDLEPETWNSRELPVLRAVTRVMEASHPGYGAGIKIVTAEVGFEHEVVWRSLRYMEDDGLIACEWTAGMGGRVRAMSGRARQLVGQWPSEVSALERMIAALDAIAEHTDDPDERSKIKSFGKWLGAGATTVGLQVAAAAITGQLPHSH